MSVKVLPPRVRDQIAAGEVVERPGSVVKELLENSLDAGARRISVELEEGGRRLIRVVDDGCGMSREDLELCVERFATSKLTDAEDLAAIATLGFRGEALPSAGSVSRLAITSRLPDQDSAWRLVVAGGEKGSPEPAGGAPGTAVEVRDLFYNVPARRKFLKSARTELNRSLAAVTGLALARPDVAFTVEHEGRTLLDLPAVERLADRVAGLYSPGLVESLAEAEAELGSGARARGLVGLPTEHRSNASDVHVFVGGRPVRDRTVTAAVGAAYTGLLPLRRYPVVFLFTEFPPGDVDFNVHPAKAEVRFARAGEVFTLIERAVRGALSRAELAAAGGPAGYDPEPDAAGRPPERVADAPPASPRPRFTGRPTALRRPKVEQESLDLWGSGIGDRGSDAARPEPQVPSPVPAPRSPITAEAAADWRYVGQALDGFLLVERGGGLLVVDQHALHERLIYEELRAGSREGSVASQGLVIPQNVETGRRHAEVLRSSREDLAALGFDIEEFGGGGFLVRAVPAAVSLSDLPGYLVELAEELAEGDAGAQSSAGSRRERVLAAVACKAAVKAGERMSPRAAEGLLRRGLSSGAEGPLHTCPHGRPTCFLLERAELARRVGRK
ncbi:MAG: DNA mismatch repair endonuclease MutL [Planctomycetota bacterium]|jgi:DNA mismatch repair protein MutL